MRRSKATLGEYVAGRATETVPVAAMIALTAESIGRRARRHSPRAWPRPAVRAESIDGISTIGGGSAPGSALPTRLVAHRARERERAGTALDGARRRAPPVIARIEDDRVVLDLRTVAPGQTTAALGDARSIACCGGLTITDEAPRPGVGDA